MPWFSPQSVFLSAYSPTDRRKLIDKLFTDFKLEFGFYPKSVGAWWIDSYSLNYLKDKYGIKTALIVADQKTTDNYGVWGQWWGVPYYPSKANILVPASSLNNKQDLVVIQWAQRDPELAIGEGPKFSNYSLQANDYIRQGKTTEYFKNLINVYLSCQNTLGQVTVGLETGSDSVVYFDEYSKQLSVIKDTPNIKPVTMEQFYQVFKQVNPENPKKVIIESKNSKWVMTPENRINKNLGDYIEYNTKISFDDYFIASKKEFLNRILPLENKQADKALPISPGLVILLALGVYSYFRNKLNIWLASSLFTLAAFGLILRSYFQFGWWVYYGPVLNLLYLYQIILPVVCFLIFLFLNRFKKLNLWLFPLVFAIDPVIQSLRVSLISGKYYIGIMFDSLRFTGINFNLKGISFVNLDLPGYIAESLLRFDYIKIWQNLFAALIVYPVLHILLAVGLSLIFKRQFKFKKLIILIMASFLLIHLIMVFNADPFAVQSLNE